MTGTTDFLSISEAEKSFAATRVLSRVDLGVSAANSSLCSGLRAAARQRCCASSPACSPPIAGNVRLDGEDITAMPPHRRDVGVVFQNYALFPHLTVAENVAFGLETRRRAAHEMQATVAALPRAGAFARLRCRSVRALSGGQQQRVAVARAFGATRSCCCSTSLSARSTASCARPCRSS